MAALPEDDLADCQEISSRIANNLRMQTIQTNHADE